MIGQGWASGLAGTAKRSTAVAPIGATIRGMCGPSPTIQPLTRPVSAMPRRAPRQAMRTFAQRRPRQDRPKQARSEQVAETTSRTGNVGHPLVLPPCDHPPSRSPPSRVHGSGIPEGVLQAASRFAISIGILPAREADRGGDAECGLLSRWGVTISGSESDAGPPGRDCAWCFQKAVRAPQVKRAGIFFGIFFLDFVVVGLRIRG